MLFLLALQAAALPDIELHATIAARSVTIEKRGEASLEVRASPDGGSLVKVEAPRGNGAKTLRNLRVQIDAEARIATEMKSSATAAPEPR